MSSSPSFKINNGQDQQPFMVDFCGQISWRFVVAGRTFADWSTESEALKAMRAEQLKQTTNQRYLQKII